MRARPLSTAARFAEASAAAVGQPLDRLIRAGRALVTGTAKRSAPRRVVARRPSSRRSSPTGASIRRAAMRSASSSSKPPRRSESAPPTCGANPAPPDASGDGLDVLTFLSRQAAASAEPLEVTITGHSKGGALAPAVALWLKDSLLVGGPGRALGRWTRGADPRHAFAGPTPGNAAFANRIDKTLGADHHHLRNTNDLVTHGWQVSDLQRDSRPVRHAHRGARVPAARRDLGRRADRLSPRAVRHGHVRRQARGPRSGGRADAISTWTPISRRRASTARASVRPRSSSGRRFR